MVFQSNFAYVFLCIKLQERFIKIQLAGIDKSNLKFKHVSAFSKNYKPINHFK